MSGRNFQTGLAFAAVLAAAALSGCQQLFTTSLAAPLARDEVTLPATLTAAEAADLAEQAKAEGDEKLAAAVVGKLVDQVTDPATQTELAAAAASAAVTASGASTAVLDAVGEALKTGDMASIDTIQLLADIRQGATSDIVAALGFLDPDPATGIGDPANLTGTELSATDYLIAAVVIAATSSALDGADPAHLTADQQIAFEGSPEYLLAADILNQAKTMATEDGSQAADLLNQFSAMFGM